MRKVLLIVLVFAVLGFGVYLFFGRDRRVSSLDEEILFEDVATHSSRGDCWLTIGGLVYDLTEFIKTSPGDVFADRCGSDASEVFLNIDDKVKQNRIGDLLPDYLLGTLTTR